MLQDEDFKRKLFKLSADGTFDYLGQYFHVANLVSIFLFET